MNPLLPLSTYVPDVEAREWQDGNLYLYGSYDICGNKDYCSDEYHVFCLKSCGTWQDEGTIFTKKQAHGIRSEQDKLYAPDCIYKDGKYYLYYCLSDNSLGVAVSESPKGPFSSGIAVRGADGDGIDPAVLVDDDGQAYLFWGQYRLRGAKLKENMLEIDEDSLRTDVIDEARHGFHEGASLRKIGGKYYLSYTDISRGNATCISYAVSDTPLGEYTKGGVIIDNTGCDPQSWNNHGSIASFDGKWYIFYHRSTHNGKFSRRVCAEPICFEKDGAIREVEMTTQGWSSALDPLRPIEASRACLLSGGAYIDSENRNGQYCEYVGHFKGTGTLVYKYYRFDRKVEAFSVTFDGGAEDCIAEVFVDSLSGKKIASAPLSAAEGNVTVPVLFSPKGRHALLVCVKTGGEHDLKLRTLRFM